LARFACSTRPVLKIKFDWNCSYRLIRSSRSVIWHCAGTSLHEVSKQAVKSGFEVLLHNPREATLLLNMEGFVFNELEHRLLSLLRQ